MASFVHLSVFKYIYEAMYLLFPHFLGFNFNTASSTKLFWNRHTCNSCMLAIFTRLKKARIWWEGTNPWEMGITIVIECNENISMFTSAKHEWKFECFITRDENCLWYSLKKSKFSFYFIVYTPMRVSDVINNVTKQNMNAMASTLSAYHVKRWRDKNKKKKKIGKSK